MNGMLSQDEINMLLTMTGSEDCDNEVLRDDLFELPIICYRSFNLDSGEGIIMMDYLLFPELKKSHEILRQEEAMLSPEDKKAGHTEFVKHCEEILRYSYVARKEGLLSLEEVATEKEKNPEGVFDKELIQMVVEGCDPEVVKRIILLKYFSSEQTVIEKIKNIMSIYGFLSIQAGENPRIILQMLANMIPSDVRDQTLNIPYRSKKEVNQKEVTIDDYCVGDIRLREKDLGYFETKVCEEMLLSLHHNLLQRVLRDVSIYGLANAMEVFSGICRRHIFDNLSSRVAQDLARNLRLDDSLDEKTYYLHSEWELKRIRDEIINILTIIDRLEKSAEIVMDINSNARFLALVMKQIHADANRKKSKEKECDLLIETIRNYKHFELGTF